MRAKNDENEALKAQILELQTKVQRQEEEEKGLESDKGIGKVVQDLNKQLATFQSQYNKNELHELFNKQPNELLDTNSMFNNKYNKDKQSVDNLVNTTKSFNKYIQDIDGIITKLCSVDVTQYRSWNVEQIIIWIRGLDNGRFREYINILRHGFEESAIKGSDLADITSADLSVTPFNITNFRDKKDLVQHFQSLVQAHKPIMEEEGAPTAFI